MAETLLLSRTKLATFLACQRRFQLRYVDKRPWPELPLPEADEERLGRGQQFHQLLHRHFLGLPVESATVADRTVRGWWLTFEKYKPALPTGRVLPELTLTVPIGAHLLHGRFDLLVIGEENGRPLAHIFDWKTGRPQEETDLRHEWQTRLYLALLAEGGQALWDHANIAAEQISITYWYVNEPDKPRTIAYNQAWHSRNWAEIQQIVSQIEAQLADGSAAGTADGRWPLTDDWSHCQSCQYQAFCGRQAAGSQTGDLADDGEPEILIETGLEPELP